MGIKIYWYYAFCSNDFDIFILAFDYVGDGMKKIACLLILLVIPVLVFARTRTKFLMNVEGGIPIVTTTTLPPSECTDFVMTHTRTLDLDPGDGKQARNLSLDSSGDFLYVCTADSGGGNSTVHKINTDTFLRVNTLGVTTQCNDRQDLAIDSINNIMYIISTTAGGQLSQLTRINLNTFTQMSNVVFSPITSDIMRSVLVDGTDFYTGTFRSGTTSRLIKNGGAVASSGNTNVPMDYLIDTGVGAGNRIWGSSNTLPVVLFNKTPSRVASVAGTNGNILAYNSTLDKVYSFIVGSWKVIDRPTRTLDSTEGIINVGGGDSVRMDNTNDKLYSLNGVSSGHTVYRYNTGTFVREQDLDLPIFVGGTTSIQSFTIDVPAQKIYAATTESGAVNPFRVYEVDICASD